jgi:cell wall-associated NlpC family hydrolase
MEAGDDYSIWFSRQASDGCVAANAVKVAKVPSSAVSSKPRERSSDSIKGREVVKKVESWADIPYRLGRPSRFGVDCSGLTMLVYREFGIELPHDADEQYDYGSWVSAPRAGDLLFYNEHDKGILHVEIATGKGTVLYALSPLYKVAETHIEGYVCAKRLL